MTIRRRVDALEERIRPEQDCYLVDWGNGLPKCPHGRELSPDRKECASCRDVPEANRRHIIVQWLPGRDEPSRT